MNAIVVMCRVSGGVTGTREAPLKDRDGKIRYFDTIEAARDEALMLNSRPANPYSTCCFKYWAVQS